MEIEEQHPIPQQVSSYQFKLVGDMTLQQFFQVAGGALIALLIYSSGLPSYIKWPLIIFSFVMGIALAFFPLEDRPLAKWIVLFFKAIYSPTLYVWKKLPDNFSYFQPETSTQAEDNKKTSPQLLAIMKTSDEQAKLETQESQILQNINNSFSELAYIPTNKVDLADKGITYDRRGIQFPKTEAIKIKPQPKKETQQTLPDKAEKVPSTGFKLTPSEGRIYKDIKQAQFSSEAAPPLPPSKPNIIVGQVQDTNGKIIENAILEIRDSNGRPARALRSNKLGHFMIVTPLVNGNYQIITEKEGFLFEPINISALGKIIPPIVITGKEKVNN